LSITEQWDNWGADQGQAGEDGNHGDGGEDGPHIDDDNFCVSGEK